MMSQEDPQYAEITIYGYADPKTPLDVLHQALSPQFLEQINAEGAGQITLSLSDEKLSAQPNLLDYFNIVKISIDGTVRSAFIIQNRSDDIVDSDEESGKKVTVSGNGLRQWLSNAAVYPEGGMRQTAPDTRVFSWASQRGSWYVPTDWKTPVRIEKYHIAPDNTPDLQYTYNPAEWPDAPNAWWVWSQAYKYETVNGKRLAVAPPGNNYYRYEFTVSEDDAGSYSLFAAADDSYVAFIDSAVAIDGTQPIGTTQYHQTVRYDFEAEAGKHVLAFRVTNRKRQGSNTRNPAALIAALFKAGDADSGIAAKLIVATGNVTGWAVNGYPEKEPGWSVGEIFLTLLSEAKDRGVLFPNWITPTFTPDVDSNGVPWADNLPFSFNVGDTYLDVLKSMEELAVEGWIDPDTYEFHIAQKRGTDKTFVSDTSDAVVLREGYNLLTASLDGEADLTNSLMLKTDDGWLVTQPADGTSQSRYGKIESMLSTSVNSSLSKKLSDKVFQTKALAEHGSTYTLIPMPGAVPFVDFEVGDYVLAPDSDGELASRRVASIAVTTDTSGIPAYAVEFDTIFETKEAEYDRMVKLASGSGLGAGFVSADGAGSGGSSPSTGAGTVYQPQNPASPENLTIVSEGYWTKLGVPQARATITWDPVDLDVLGGPVKGITKYEVLARTSTAVAYQSLGTVTGALTQVIVQGLRADQDYYFVIRAFVSDSRMSNLSDPVLHHTAVPATLMPAPTNPTLTTKLGTVTALWDGKLVTGVVPAQFQYVYAETATSESGPWSQAGSTPIAGGIVITGQPIGSTVYVRLRATDVLGRPSDPSGTVSIVVDGVSTDDLGQQFEDDFQAIKDQAADAQTKAGQAAAAAEAAQKAAEDAAEASGGIIYQEDTPDASMAGRLWVKPSTKKSYLYDTNTQQWEEITDPDIAAAAQAALDAKNAADSATKTANTAAEQAGQALTAANGKNKNFYLPDAPAGTDFTVGDQWWDTDNDFAVSRWNGTAWVPTLLGNGAFSTLDAGKIGTGFLDAGRIQSATITSRMLAVGDFKDYLDGSNFEGATSTIPWINIPDANAVLDTTIKHNGTKSVRMLTTGSYTAPPITTVTNNYTNFANNPEAQNNTTSWFNLNNAGYKFERINLATSDQYQGAATGVRLYPGTGTPGGLRLRVRVPVTPGMIASMSMGLRTNDSGRNLQMLLSFTTSDGATEAPSKVRYSVPAKKMTANTWQLFTLENFSVPDDAQFVMIDSYSANSWSSNSQYIIGTAVMVNQGSAALPYFSGNTPNSTNSDASSTYTNTYAWTGTAGNSTSTWTQKVDTIGDAPAQPTREYSSNYDVPVQAGQRMVLSGWFYVSSLYNGDNRGAYLEIRNPATGAVLGQTTLGVSVLTKAGTWTQVSTSATIPAGTTSIRAYIRVNHTRGLIYVDDVSLKNGAGVLIEEGAITAPMLRADSVTANAIQAGAVQTEQLDAYAITSKHTITGALIQTSDDGARAEMNSRGFRVIADDGTDLVRLGYGLSTGMSIRDPTSQAMIPLANMAFGAKNWSSNTNFTVGSTATESTWSGYTTETLGDWIAPSNRVIWLWFALSAESNQQNFKIEGQAYMVDSTDTSVGARVVLTNGTPIYWTSGFFMGGRNVVAGRTYSVRNSYRSWRNFSGTGTPTIVTRTTILMPV